MLFKSFPSATFSYFQLAFSQKVKCSDLHFQIKKVDNMLKNWEKISLIKFLIEDWCWGECRNNPCIIIIIQTGRTIILFNQKVVLRQYKRLGIKRPANLGWTRGIDVNYAFAALRNPIWFWPQCMISRPIEANKLFFPAAIFSSIAQNIDIIILKEQAHKARRLIC